MALGFCVRANITPEKLPEQVKWLMFLPNIQYINILSCQQNFRKEEYTDIDLPNKSWITPYGINKF